MTHAPQEQEPVRRLVDLRDPVAFYYVALGVMLLFVFLTYRIVNSRFGMLLRAAKSNEARSRAIGFRRILSPGRLHHRRRDVRRGRRPVRQPHQLHHPGLMACTSRAR